MRYTMAFSIDDNRSPLEQFLQGEAARAYHFLGSHFENWDGRQGCVFRVWAPNAKSVSVVGDFNDWNPDAHYMYRISDSGVWELFIPDVWEFACYKYCVETPARPVPTTPRAPTTSMTISGTTTSGYSGRRIIRTRSRLSTFTR